MISDFRIRRAKHSDAPGIIAAHVRSIREVCSRDYSPTQIAAWSGRDFRESIWQRTIDRDHVWVLELHGTIVGFGHVRVQSEDLATIEGLYFTPEAKGRGLGRKLLTMIYEELRTRGISAIWLQSTKTAEGFYRAMGFSPVRETSVVFDRVAVECIEMENNEPCLP